MDAQSNQNQKGIAYLTTPSGGNMLIVLESVDRLPR